MSQAIKAMKRELAKLQRSMAKCVDDCGHVKADKRYEYQIYVERAKSFKDSIEWMENKVYGQKQEA